MSDDPGPGRNPLLACLAICFAALFAPTGAGAATLTVTTTADELDPSGAQNGACSLREAVFAIDQGSNYAGATPDCTATGSAYGTNDTIALGPQTYELTLAPVLNPDGNQDGDLDLFKSVTIDGAGAGAGGTVIDANGLDRALDLISVPAHTVVLVQDLTITGGDTNASSSGDGGAIRIGDTDAEFEVRDAAIRDSESVNHGGAIAFPNALSTAVLEIDGSELAGNTAGSRGGAVYFETTSPGEMVISYSALIGNQAARGGALYLAGFPSSSAAYLKNTTVSGNSARLSGGGIELGEAPVGLELVFSTIAQNTAPETGARGGGIRIASGASPTVIEFDSSIIAGNAAVGAPSNCDGTFTLSDGGYNIQSGTDCGFALANTNPLLAPLGLYGGPTRSHGLYDGSPALDLADCGGSSGLDQRYVSRPSRFGGVPGCDAGAFEGSVGPVPTVPAAVSPPAAVVPGIPTATTPPKCKKGRKLKKGKCVKKKRKRAHG